MRTHGRLNSATAGSESRHMANLRNWLKKLRRQRAITRAFGSNLPTEVRIVEGKQPLQIDPLDERARKILLFETARGRRRPNQAFWFDAVRTYQPTLALDIGLNYGECLLSIPHPGVRELHGFEANPNLMPYVKRTAESHPDRDRLLLHNNAVSNETGRVVHLAVHEGWSGGSHLAETGIAVETLAVDDAVHTRPDDRLLFKIDVEGFEPPVVEGMLQTVDSVVSSVGFIEFAGDLIAERGHDVEAYWDLLRSRFDLYFCRRIGEATPIADVPWSQQPRRVQERHCDLIVTSRSGVSSRSRTQPDCRYAADFLKAWRSGSRSRAA